MRRLLIYSDSSDRFCGTEQINHELALGLQTAGYSVAVAQPWTSHDLVNQRSSAEINHYWIEDNNRLEPVQPFGYENRDQSRHVLDDVKPDLILFNDSCPLSNLAAKKIAKDNHLPYVSIVQRVDLTLAESRAPYLDKLPSIFVAAESVIGSSQSTLDLLYGHLGLPLDRGAVIYPGRPAAYFASPKLLNRKKLRSQYNIPDDAILCLTIANFTAEMGIECYLDAIQQLKQKGKLGNLHFVWIGREPNRGSLQDLVSESIQEHLTYLEPTNDLINFFDAADVFVHLTRHQATPLVIMEAMAKGLPVIATSVDGVRELVDETGFLLPDPIWGPVATILGKTLSWMDQSEQLRLEMGLAGAKHAQQFFRSDQMVNSYLNLIEALFYRLEIGRSTESKKAVEEEFNSPPQL